MRLIDRPETFYYPPLYYMRERDITKSLLQRTLRDIKDDSSPQVMSIHIVLGELLEFDLLLIQTHWQEFSKGTPAEQSQLHFRLIPAEVQCMACFQKYLPRDKKILCPYCGSFGAKILTGEECYLESIETE